MRRLPWQVAARADRRALLTAGGVALGVAFTLLSFAVPDGLRTEAIAPEGPFGRQDVLVSRALDETFEVADLQAPGATIVRVATVPLQQGGNVTLAAFEGPRAPPLDDGRAYPAAGAVGLPATIHPAGEADPLPYGAPLDLPILSRGWVAVSSATLVQLRPELQDKASYALLPPPVDDATAQRLASAGFRLAPTPAVEPFFRASAAEIARDLVLVVAFSAALVVLFTYEFLRSEIRERWREIGLWRAIGMRERDVLWLLLVRALAITAAGGVLGAAITYFVLEAAARATGSSVFSPSLDAATVSALAGSFLLAGLLGGFLPARAAARATIREQMEAPP